MQLVLYTLGLDGAKFNESYCDGVFELLSTCAPTRFKMDPDG